MLNIHRGTLLHTDERSILCVPRTVLLCLFLALVLQAGFRYEIRQTGQFRQLPNPPTLAEARLASLSDAVALSKMTMLWLQSFDTQPGISVSFKQIDYEHVIGWLDLVLRLDPHGLYPLLSASRIYAEVNDENRQRKMLAFVHERFLEDPKHRWPAMADAVYVARYRLKDTDLALEYARDLSQNVAAYDVPPWIKQMQIYVLEDMGNLEAAMVLIGGLLESGEVSDPQEIRFLQQRLDRLREESGKSN